MKQKKKAELKEKMVKPGVRWVWREGTEGEGTHFALAAVFGY